MERAADSAARSYFPLFAMISSDQITGAADVSGGGMVAPSRVFALPTTPEARTPMLNIDRPAIDAIPSGGALPGGPGGNVTGGPSRSLNAEPVIAAGNYWRAHWPYLLIAALALLVVFHHTRTRGASA